MHKKTLVLLPALMCDERLFSHQINYLKDTFKIIVPLVSNFDNIEAAANDILHTIKDETFYLAGISMGGYIAMNMMKVAPQRIIKLCLMNTTWDSDSPQKKQQRLDTIETTLSTPNEQFSGINDKIITDYLYNPSPEHNNLIKSMVKDLGKECFVNQLNLILSRKSSIEDFKNYTCSTLIIAGKHDEITPPSVAFCMKESLPKGQLIILDECKHLSPIDQKIALSALLKLWFNC